MLSKGAGGRGSPARPSGGAQRQPAVGDEVEVQRRVLSPRLDGLGDDAALVEELARLGEPALVGRHAAPAERRVGLNHQATAGQHEGAVVGDAEDERSLAGRLRVVDRRQERHAALHDANHLGDELRRVAETHKNFRDRRLVELCKVRGGQFQPAGLHQLVELGQVEVEGIARIGVGGRERDHVAVIGRAGQRRAVGAQSATTSRIGVVSTNLPLSWPLKRAMSSAVSMIA